MVFIYYNINHFIIMKNKIFLSLVLTTLSFNTNASVVFKIFAKKNAINLPAPICQSSVQKLSYTGSLETITVPKGCGHATVTLAGANGGYGYRKNNGGYGDVISGTISVSSNENLIFLIGEKGGYSKIIGGTSLGGYGGGGNGMPYAAGGGGGTFLWKNSKSNSNLIAVAGGGGGASDCDNGGDGNYPNGWNGGYSCSYYGDAGGQGGTQSSGGVGYNSGSYGQGGSATDQSGFTKYGGGGGGGYYGGGAGKGVYYNIAGGGGSSYIDKLQSPTYTLKNNTITYANGWAKIIFSP